MTCVRVLSQDLCGCNEESTDTRVTLSRSGQQRPYLPEYQSRNVQLQ
jgi:hypothetical protein